MTEYTKVDVQVHKNDNETATTEFILGGAVLAITLPISEDDSVLRAGAHDLDFLLKNVDLLINGATDKLVAEMSRLESKVS